MIDKSIRQHYANGKIVDPFIEGMQKIWRDPTTQKLKSANIGQNLKQTYFPQREGRLDKTQLAKNIGGQFLTNLATKKALSGIMGTGALSFLGPLAPFAAMFLANKAVGKGKEYLGQAYRTGDMTQGFQPPGLPSLFRVPGQTQAQWEADRQLEQLQKRKEYMWDRMLEDKTYSEKNLIDVINQIAKKTGAVDADDMGIDLTPTAPIRQDPDTGDASLAERIAEEAREAKKKEINEIISQQIGSSRGNGISTAGPTVAETAAMEDIISVPAPVSISVPVPAHIREGGGGGSQGTARGDPGGGIGGLGGHGPARWAKGGRVDKALGGRSRDI
jgi:hypothetical protein